MSKKIRLKPRSTRIFENEQKSRFSPNSVTSGLGGGAGRTGTIHLAADATELLDSGITLFNNAGSSFAAIRVLDDVAVVDNGAFTLTNDGVLSVASQLAVVLIDPNDSITNYAVTIIGLDEFGGGLNEVITFTSGGEVQFTVGLFKSVTSITGGVITGTFTGDELRVAPRIGTGAHDIVTRASDPFSNFLEQDPNNASGHRAAYAEAIDIADKEVRVSFPTIPAEVLSISQVKFQWETKNLAATSNGIDYIIRHSGVTYIIGNNSVNTTPTANSTTSGVITLTVAPGTGEPWTVAQLNGLEVGVVMKGDNPTVQKQFMRVRIEFDCLTLPTGTVSPIVADAFVEAVAGDPFDEGSGDDGKYVGDFAAQNTRLEYGYPDLPVEAIGVLNVKCFWRVAAIHGGHPNGMTTNTDYCAIGGANGASEPSVQPRGGTGRHYGQGPIEQSNLGGYLPGVRVSGFLENFGDEGGSHVLIGPGNPEDGCGFAVATQSGRNIPWGTPNNHSALLTTTPVGNNPWSVVSFDDIETVFQVGGREEENRWLKTYVEPEWLRKPTGETFLHLAIDDDPEAPDDSKFMVSQHPANKKFGVDFAGIEEVIRVIKLQATIRAKTAIGATAGWRMIWRIAGQADILEPIQTNTLLENEVFERSVNPNTGLPFTRAEVNSLIVIWEAQGENAFFPKDLSIISLEAEVDPIPAKIDNARRIISEKLLMLGKPVPLLRATLPLEFADAGLMRDIVVSHKAIPRTEKTLGFEVWARSIMRAFTKEYVLENDTMRFELFDLRDYLVTFLFTGQTTSKGRSFDGMMIITNGVTVDFQRATNDYQKDPFANRLQELNADEPPANLEGVLVMNSATNRLFNSGFGEGATNVFDFWTKFGDGLPGASIVEDLTDLVWDPNFLGAPQRSALLTGATTPGDVGLRQDITIATGDNLTPEGSRYAVQVLHKDDDGEPLSIAFDVDPPSFGEHHHNLFDQSWSTAGGTQWFTLPVRSVPTLERVIGHLDNMETINQSPAGPTVDLQVKLAVRTAANQKNHLYGVQVEGGTLVSGAETGYPTSIILTKTGPVVRDAGELFVPNRRDSPSYYLVRGTTFCVIQPLWDALDLPEAGGARRYVYGLVLNTSNHDLLYYDQDLESFVFERKVAGVVAKATKFFPAVAAGKPIRLATRWISNLGDLEETPFSIQIFVDDERGVDATAVGTPVIPNLSNLYLGSKDGTDGEMLDGRVRRVRITQQVLPDKKIRKLR